MLKKYIQITIYTKRLLILFFIFLNSCSNSEILLVKSDIDSLKLEIEQEKIIAVENKNKIGKLENLINDLKINFKFKEEELINQKQKMSEIEEKITKILAKEKNNSNEIFNLSNKFDSLNNLILISDTLNQKTIKQNNNLEVITSNVNVNNIETTSKGSLYLWGSNYGHFGYLYGRIYASPSIINEYDWLYVKEYQNMIFGLSNDSTLYLLNYDNNTDSLIIDINKNKFELIKNVRTVEYSDFNKKFMPVQISKIKFKFIESMKNGNNTLFCIDKDGLLWVYGNNEFGQFGIGNNKSFNSYLSKTNFKCDTIIANKNTVLAIKEDGTLWGWGDNGGNKMCIDNYNDSSPYYNAAPILSPKYINNIKWIDLKICDGYILAVKDNNTLWWWSNRVHFVLKYKDTEVKIEKHLLNQPRLLLEGNWLRVESIINSLNGYGSNLIALLSTDNFVYLYGKEDYRGTDKFLHLFTNKFKIDTLNDCEDKYFRCRYYLINKPLKVFEVKIKDILFSNKYNNNMTNTHSEISLLLLTNEDYLYGLGGNGYYNFGLGNNNYLSNLTKLNDLKWNKIYSFSDALFFGKTK